MNKNKRFTKILDILKTEGNASTKYLAAIVQIYEAIIRRDLTELAGSDLFPVRNESSWRSNILFGKVGINAMFNIKLSRLLEDVYTVIFDSGTTVCYLASELVKKEEEMGF